jgi:HK97 family phage prohead protease
MNQKAFSAIVIKEVSEDLREFSGMASTPASDRVNDVIDPMGLTFPPEAPLLLNHKSDQPVGVVRFGKATAKGLPFKAKIPKIREAGTVKDRTEEAWHSIKSGLIKGVSIGFIPKEYEPTKDGKGVHYKKAAIHELSLTAIPCNPEAMITAFKSLRGSRAVSNQGRYSEWLEIHSKALEEEEQRKARNDAFARLMSVRLYS